MKYTLALFISALFLTSCGGGGDDKKANDDNNVNGATLLRDDGPVYDRNAIDPDAPVVKITIKATGNTMAEMKYDKTTLEVPAGSTVTLTFISESQDESMPHNWILIKKGTAEKVAAKAMEAGANREYIPVMPEVLVASSLLKPNGKEEIIFPAPAVGEYQFVCTYPGHWQQMQGVFIVK